MFTLKQLISWPNTVHINGKYVPARPLPDGLLARIKAAWQVLSGQADAFTWPEGQ